MKILNGLFSKDVTPAAVKPEHTGTLDNLMEEMVRYGKPRLFCSDDNTWHCCIKMNVSSKFSEFEIKSGYNHKTPQDAALACVANLNEALREMKGHARI